MKLLSHLSQQNVTNKNVDNVTATGPCRGDSGGGFYVNNEDNLTFKVQGIVSTGSFNKTLQKCNNDNYFIFTDVARYTEWITFHIDASECSFIANIIIYI
jgi:secreted trypsin-like serine protease